MFLLSAVTFSTFTAGPSSISYRVTCGPRREPVTCASTWNSSSTCVRAATVTLLAAVIRCGTGPDSRTAMPGAAYSSSSRVGWRARPDGAGPGREGAGLQEGDAGRGVLVLGQGGRAGRAGWRGLVHGGDGDGHLGQFRVHRRCREFMDGA